MIRIGCNCSVVKHQHPVDPDRLRNRPLSASEVKVPEVDPYPLPLSQRHPSLDGIDYRTLPRARLDQLDNVGARHVQNLGRLSCGDPILFGTDTCFPVAGIVTISNFPRRFDPDFGLP